MTVSEDKRSETGREEAGDKLFETRLLSFCFFYKAVSFLVPGVFVSVPPFVIHLSKSSMFLL